MKRSTLASRPAAIIEQHRRHQEEGDRELDLRRRAGGVLLDPAALDPAQRGRLLAQLIGERGAVAAGALDHPAHRRHLAHGSAPAERGERLALGQSAGALRREHRQLARQRPLPAPSSPRPASGLRPAAVPTASRSSASGSPARSARSRRRAPRSSQASGPRTPAMGRPTATIQASRVGAAGARTIPQSTPATAPPSFAASRARTEIRSPRPALARRAERRSLASAVDSSDHGAGDRGDSPLSEGPAADRRGGTSSAIAARPSTTAPIASSRAPVNPRASPAAGSGRIPGPAERRRQRASPPRRAPRAPARRSRVGGVQRTVPPQRAGRRRGGP